MKQLNGGHIKKRQSFSAQSAATAAGQGWGQAGGKGPEREGEWFRGCLSLKPRMAAHLAHYKMPQRKKPIRAKPIHVPGGVGGEGAVEEPCIGLAMSEEWVRGTAKGVRDSCSAIKWRARCLIKSQRINRAQLTSNLSLLVSLPLSPLSFSLFHFSPPLRSRVICSAVTDTTLVFQHFL